MSQHRLTIGEIRFLDEALRAEHRQSSIRLREGEHQYAIAKTIASFQLELDFPDVKQIVGRLYAEEKTDDIQLIRKIQTILKKMEKSNILKILPKKKPWELQRYALSSFKFQDSDKNLVALAAEEQIKHAQSLLDSTSKGQAAPITKWNRTKAMVQTSMLTFIVVVSYMGIVWDIMQPIISPVIFVLAFSVSVIGSIMLGRMLSTIKP
jgi:hypothetical protein